jgi:hypothetical protein
MSDKTKFWVLLVLLMLSIALAVILNTNFNKILLGS